MTHRDTSKGNTCSGPSLGREESNTGFCCMFKTSANTQAKTLSPRDRIYLLEIQSASGIQMVCRKVTLRIAVLHSGQR